MQITQQQRIRQRLVKSSYLGLFCEIQVAAPANKKPEFKLPAAPAPQYNGKELSADKMSADNTLVS
jgi:hypothetical protein